MLKKLENFWYYYKWHALVAVFLLIVITVSVRSCVFKITPDMGILYIGNGYIDYDVFEKNKVSLENSIEDINDDNRAYIAIDNASFSDMMTQNQIVANQTKITLAIGMGEKRVYLMEKQYCEEYAKLEAFAPLNDLFSDEALKDALIDENQNIYGVKIDNRQYLESLGINSRDELYLSLRIVSEVDKKENENIDAINEQAIKLVKHIKASNDSTK